MLLPILGRDNLKGGWFLDYSTYIVKENQEEVDIERLLFFNPILPGQ